jgi:2-methylisocitrate lyase-like PEP mutase family enzyme
MTRPTTALRALIDGGPPFIAADCYSALTGRIIEQTGFKAAYMGGHATSMMHYAIPDCGIYTPTEAIDQAGRVAEAITIPLIVDADSCGETVADVHRSIGGYVRAGVAGIHIEDEVSPKHSTWDGQLMDVEDMQERISVAAEARVDPDFVIIARCDELYRDGGGGTGSLDEMIARGKAYAEAGADVFLANFATDEQLPAIIAEVPIPVTAYGGLRPGLAFSLSTGWGVAAATQAHQRWAAELFETGELPWASFGVEGKDELIRQPLYDGIVERWARRKGLALRPEA